MATSFVQTIMRTSDSTAVNNSTVLVSDSQLTFTIPGDSQTVLCVEGFLIVSAPDATSDFKCSWSVPAGVTGYWGPLASVSNQGGWASGNAGTAAAALTTSLAGTYGFGTFAGITGVNVMALLFTGSTSGTVALQWAQNTGFVGDTKLLTGSFLRLTKVR